MRAEEASPVAYRSSVGGAGVALRALPAAALMLAGGCILALALFSEPFWWVAFVALLPVLLAMDRGRRRRAISAGILFPLPSIALGAWQLLGPAARHGVTDLSGLAFALGVFSVGIMAVWTMLFFWIHRALPRSLTGLLVVVPLAYAGLEFVSTRAFSFFPVIGPYLQLGLTQAHSFSPVLQLLDLVGVYGVSAFVVMVNLLLFALATRRVAPRRRAFGIGMGVIVLILGYGLLRRGADWSGEPVNVAVLGTRMHRADFGHYATFRRFAPMLESYVGASVAGTGRNIDVVVWPELAVPFPVASFAPVRTRLQAFADTAGMGLVTGGFHFEPEAHGHWRGHNALYVFERGEPAQQVRHKLFDPPLDAVGLTAPSRKIRGLFGLAFEDAAGSMTMTVGGRPVCAIVCFEGLFTSPIRESVSHGAEYLVQSSNEAPYRRFLERFLVRHSVARAVENRRWLCRASNVGFSGFVAPDGTASMAVPDESTMLLTHAVAARRGRTVYTRFGRFINLAYLATALWLIVGSGVVALRHR